MSLELIQYLACRGARKFVLVTKNSQPSGYKALVLKRLNNKNVTVVISLADPSTVKGAEDVLNEAANLGPISGVYHISTVGTLNDFFVTYSAQVNYLYKNRLQKQIFCNR